MSRLTEPQVAEMEARVLTQPIDPAIERAWARETLATLAPTEQRLMAEWKLWKFTRQDERMRATDAELAHVRACLAYLRDLVKE